MAALKRALGSETESSCALGQATPAKRQRRDSTDSSHSSATAASSNGALDFKAKVPMMYAALNAASSSHAATLTTPSCGVVKVSRPGNATSPVPPAEFPLLFDFFSPVFGDGVTSPASSMSQSYRGAPSPPVAGSVMSVPDFTSSTPQASPSSGSNGHWNKCGKIKM